MSYFFDYLAYEMFLTLKISRITVVETDLNNAKLLSSVYYSQWMKAITFGVGASSN